MEESKDIGNDQSTTSQRDTSVKARINGLGLEVATFIEKLQMIYPKKKLQVVIGANTKDEDVAESGERNFRVAEMIAYLDEHLPNMRFERVAFSCPEISLDQLNWFWKRSGAISISRTKVLPAESLAKLEEMQLNQNQVKELTLI